MTLKIEEQDFWWFRMLYEVVEAFADAPEYSISRIGDTISVTDDQANQLDNFQRCILEKYPPAANIAIMRLVAQFDLVLSRRSLGGEEFDEEFWTNEAFHRHPDWVEIRMKAREFLLR